ncbi:hypothetical protein Srubr_23950 [Streptomyces rubradiris]|uniref:Uncharacterized protein n=1 Tax=Streptomyces rubradiris TaxID=285531 RepID=A0ABQ3R9L2_STRRR|nr:hypothetical protein Srubr_23950 [Streptomyces rubradiris]
MPVFRDLRASRTAWSERAFGEPGAKPTISRSARGGCRDPTVADGCAAAWGDRTMGTVRAASAAARTHERRLEEMCTDFSPPGGEGESGRRRCLVAARNTVVARSLAVRRARSEPPCGGAEYRLDRPRTTRPPALPTPPPSAGLTAPGDRDVDLPGPGDRNVGFPAPGWSQWNRVVYSRAL